MKKITKLVVSYPTTPRHLIEEALQIVFQHFITLSRGINRKALAEAMVNWASTRRRAQPELASVILSLVWHPETARCVSVQFSPDEVTVKTYTTAIRLHRRSDGYYVEVDFGLPGSSFQALRIFAAAYRSGVRFDAYADQEAISFRDLREEIQARAVQQLDRIPKNSVVWEAAVREANLDLFGTFDPE